MGEQLIEIMLDAPQKIVYKNGEQITVGTQQVLEILNNTLDKSYFSPAFAVTRPQDLEKMFKKGFWIEFCFNQTKTFADMPFEKLIINIKPDLWGINVMRFNEGNYSGRCFYLNLANTTNQLYKFLNSLG